MLIFIVIIVNIVFGLYILNKISQLESSVEIQKHEIYEIKNTHSKHEPAPSSSHSAKTKAQNTPLNTFSNTSPNTSPSSDTFTENTSSENLNTKDSENGNSSSINSEKSQSQLQHKTAHIPKREVYSSEHTSNTSFQNPVPDKFSELMKWLQEDWLMKLGAFLLLLGFGWLVRYAFLNNIIGPMGRITLGLISGILILAGGQVRSKKHLSQGNILLVLGATIIAVTTFAAREVYGFFTPLTALGLMSITTAFIALVSVKNKTRTLAIMGLLLGALVPILSDTNAGIVILFSYLLSLTIGYLWIIKITGWRILTPISLFIVFLYQADYISYSNLADKDILLFFAAIFATVFFFSNLIGVIVTKKQTLSDIITAAANAIIILIWISAKIPSEWQSLLTSSITLIFVLATFFVYKFTNIKSSLSKFKSPLLVYLSIAIGMLAAATAFELDGAALVIAYTLEAGAVTLLVSSLLDIKLGQATASLLAIPSLMSLEYLDHYSWQEGILHESFFVILILIITILSLAMFFYQEREKIKEIAITYLLFLVGSFYSMAFIWLSMHGLIQDSYLAVLISLMIYAIIGIYLYLQESKAFRVIGTVILGLVTARLLLIDIWDMELTGKVITFILLGGLFISSAFIKRKDEQ